MVAAPKVETQAAQGAQVEPAKLTRGAVSRLTTMVSDVRAAIARLGGGTAPLTVLGHTDAVPAMRELYYELQREDPTDAMPVRKLLGDWRFAEGCVIPILTALHTDSHSVDESRRWSATLYQTLRLVSMLCVPIEDSNAMLTPGCNLEVHLMDLKQAFAKSRDALSPLVALLQHYLQKKAENAAAFAAAEDSKVEDARIENILRFFRNLLAPPRKSVDRDLMRRDRGVHLAVVGATSRTDLFATISVLFADASDANTLQTPVVFLCAEIFALAFRHSPTRDLAISAVRATRMPRAELPQSVTVPSGYDAEENSSVFEAKKEKLESLNVHEVPTDPAPETRAGKPSVQRRWARTGLREALLRERSLVGGGRSVVASTRWATRYSGGFQQVTSRKRPLNSSDASFSGGAGRGGDVSGERGHVLGPESNLGVASSRISKSLASKRILSAKTISAAPKKGLAGLMQVGMDLNSDLFCLFGSSGLRPRIATSSRKTMVMQAVREDLVQNGRLAAASIVRDMLRESFPVLIRELHDRILHAKSHLSREDLWVGRRFYLSLVAVAAGFQLEFAKETAAEKGQTPKPTRAPTLILSAMQDDVPPRGRGPPVDWKAVEDAISLDSFRLVFDAVTDARNEGKAYAKELELATASMKEMMKLLHWMSVSESDSVHQDKREVDPIDDLGKNPSQEPSEKPESPALVIRMGSCAHGEELGSAPDGKDRESDEIGGNRIPSGEQPTSNVDGEAETTDALPLPANPVTSTIDASGEVKEGQGASDASSNPAPTSAPSSNPVPKLSPRDIALNLLEELFEREGYLETPSMLAKEFDPKIHGFSHLANIIEIASTFTTTLLGQDFARITVAKKKRKRRLKKTEVTAKQEDEGEDTPQATNNHEELAREDHVDSDLARSGEREDSHSRLEDGRPRPTDSVETDENVHNSQVGVEHKDEKSTAEGGVRSDMTEHPSGSGQPEVSRSMPQGATLSASEPGAHDTMIAEDEPIDQPVSVNAANPENIDEVADGADHAVGEESEGVYADDDKGSDVDSDGDFLEAEYKVEGGDVLRRFAAPRALQHIAFALRAALCGVSGVCTTLLPVPEGSSELLTVSVLSKSLAVLRSVWNIIEKRERGAFRFAFYNYAMLSFLGTSVAVAQERRAPPPSILHHLSTFGTEVIREFYVALQAHPVLLVDSLFLADIGTQRLYATKVHHLKLMHEAEEVRERGEQRASGDDPGDRDAKPRNRRQSKRLHRRRHQATMLSSDDEDVSLVLRHGQPEVDDAAHGSDGDSNDGESRLNKRWRADKTRHRRGATVESSDDEDVSFVIRQGEAQKQDMSCSSSDDSSDRGTPRKKRQRAKETLRRHTAVFSSSDEEDVSHLIGMPDDPSMLSAL